VRAKCGSEGQESHDSVLKYHPHARNFDLSVQLQVSAVFAITACEGYVAVIVDCPL